MLFCLRESCASLNNPSKNEAKRAAMFLSALFEGFLRAIPENLESLREEEYAAYILPALIRSPKISDTFSGKDFTQLLQIEGLPEFLLGWKQSN
jgi:hypothetical protein